MSVSVFAFCASVLLIDHRFQFSPNDPGMAKATAACFVALSSGSFVFCVLLKDARHE
jgi:hypothetical protein